MACNHFLVKFLTDFSEVQHILLLALIVFVTNYIHYDYIHKKNIWLSKQLAKGTRVINTVPEVMADSVANYGNKLVTLGGQYSQKISLLGQHRINYLPHTIVIRKNNSLNTHYIYVFGAE